MTRNRLAGDYLRGKLWQNRNGRCNVIIIEEIIKILTSGCKRKQNKEEENTQVKQKRNHPTKRWIKHSS